MDQNPPNLLNEGQRPDEGAPQSAFGTPPAQTRFIPEGYLPPDQLRRQIANKQDEMRKLKTRLDRVSDQNPETNPYTIYETQGNQRVPRINEAEYQRDNRNWNMMAVEVNQLMTSLNAAESTSQRLQGGVQQLAERVLSSATAAIPEAVRQQVVTKYRSDVQNLIYGGHFQDSRYKDVGAVETGLTQLLRAALGDAILSGGQQGGVLPTGGTSAGREGQAPVDPNAVQDPFTHEFRGSEIAMRFYERAMGGAETQPKTLAGNTNLPRDGFAAGEPAALSPQQSQVQPSSPVITPQGGVNRG